MDEMTFTAEQLPLIRQFTATRARRFGLADNAVGDLVIAVNEIATNAVRHGSPVAELRMWRAADCIVVEIYDSGHWAAPSDPGGSLPATATNGGMGLWVARQICSAVHIRTDPRGTVVRLELSRPGRYF